MNNDRWHATFNAAIAGLTSIGTKGFDAFYAPGANATDIVKNIISYATLIANEAHCRSEALDR